jgi:hypothetical protein
MKCKVFSQHKSMILKLTYLTGVYTFNVLFSLFGAQYTTCVNTHLNGFSVGLQ